MTAGRTGRRHPADFWRSCGDRGGTCVADPWSDDSSASTPQCRCRGGHGCRDRRRLLRSDQPVNWPWPSATHPGSRRHLDARHPAVPWSGGGGATQRAGFCIGDCRRPGGDHCGLQSMRRPGGRWRRHADGWTHSGMHARGLPYGAARRCLHADAGGRACRHVRRQHADPCLRPRRPPLSTLIADGALACAGTALQHTRDV